MSDKLVVSPELKARIGNNLARVRDNINSAAISAGRDPKEVCLIAVSKTKPAEYILAAYECGQRDFGENRVQEIKAKAPLLPEDIRWHMIGHLQTNKVKDVVGRACMIHSVDSLHLAQEISRISEKKDLVSDILLEINPEGEISKTGIKSEDEVIHLVKEVAALPGLGIKGLMTVPPIDDDTERLLGYFRRLRELAHNIGGQHIERVRMDILSMGMTGDYEAAIREGSTHVRVGTGIFGEREVTGSYGTDG